MDCSGLLNAFASYMGFWFTGGDRNQNDWANILVKWDDATNMPDLLERYPLVEEFPFVMFGSNPQGPLGYTHGGLARGNYVLHIPYDLSPQWNYRMWWYFWQAMHNTESHAISTGLRSIRNCWLFIGDVVGLDNAALVPYHRSVEGVDSNYVIRMTELALDTDPVMASDAAVYDFIELCFTISKQKVAEAASYITWNVVTRAANAHDDNYAEYVGAFQAYMLQMESAFVYQAMALAMQTAFLSLDHTFTNTPPETYSDMLRRFTGPDNIVVENIRAIENILPFEFINLPIDDFFAWFTELAADVLEAITGEGPGAEDRLNQPVNGDYSLATTLKMSMLAGAFGQITRATPSRVEGAAFEPLWRIKGNSPFYWGDMQADYFYLDPDHPSIACNPELRIALRGPQPIQIKINPPAARSKFRSIN
jgi:hypothetical protein